MSDIENLDVIIGDSSRNEYESNTEDRNTEVDLGSDRPRQDLIQNSDSRRSLLNTNIWENKENTIETSKLITSEVKNQASRKLH